MIDRRDVLRGIGASSLAWAFGCHRMPPIVSRPTVSGEVRSWLRDSVARLAGVFPYAQAFAVTRRRTAAAIDVVGTGVSRAQYDTVLLRVRERTGGWREQITAELTRDGVAAATGVLAGSSTKTGRVSFGTPQRAVPALALDPRTLDDKDFRDRVQQIIDSDDTISSRIVYAAAALDIDDSTIWSVTPDSDREQRLVRVRQSATRVAWNGLQPMITEANAGWTGGVGDHEIAPDEIKRATASALELMTPGAIDDGVYTIALDPSIVAMVIDASVRGLLTTSAARRPEVASRLAVGASVASPVLALADDPTQPGSYGGFAFDDDGQPASRVVLVEAGRVVGRLDRAMRAGHTGPSEPEPSHLQLAAGAIEQAALLDDGFLLERGQTAAIDPSSDRIVVAAARAREWRGGRRTGRVFADVELVGDLGVLLGSVSAIGSDVATTAIRDDASGLPRWRSIETPSLRLRGTLRPRRLA
jgi:predicted Zn-dependent protease